MPWKDVQDTICQAALSGALIPRTEADAAIAATVDRAMEALTRDELSGDMSPGAAQWARDTIRALITQPQSGALAAVRAEARREAGRIAGLAVANIEIGFHDGISGDWRPMDGPSILSAACAAIRAALADAEGGDPDGISTEAEAYFALTCGAARLEVAQ